MQCLIIGNSVAERDLHGKEIVRDAGKRFIVVIDQSNAKDGRRVSDLAADAGAKIRFYLTCLLVDDVQTEVMCFGCCFPTAVFTFRPPLSRSISGTDQ